MDATARRGAARHTPTRARLTAGLAALAVVVTYWAAVQPGAEAAQAGFVTWVNDPPQPIGAVLAVTGSLFRPLPLALVAVGLVVWVLATVRGRDRWEVVRATAAGFLLSEAVTQVLKRMAGQPRPTTAVPGLDVHGYPKDPYGNAYPSAHTAVVVGILAAVWPWLTWPQRAVGVTVAVLVAANRLYIGAHWPIDVVGGVAIGMLAGALCRLGAARWPVGGGRRPGGGPSGGPTGGSR